jgi:hypothetical protein
VTSCPAASSPPSDRGQQDCQGQVVEEHVRSNPVVATRWCRLGHSHSICARITGAIICPTKTRFNPLNQPRRLVTVVRPNRDGPLLAYCG